MPKLVALVCVTLVLNACASSKPATSDSSTIGPDIDVEGMSNSEAAQVLQEFRTKYGLSPGPVDVREITSMAEVIEIIRQDRLGAFDAARSYTAGKKGPEALTVRAYLELSLASGMLTAAAILERERKEDLTELKQLERRRSFGSAAEDAPQKAEQISTLREKTEDLRKAIRALRVLSEEPLSAGKALAEQAISEDPDIQLGYLAMAYYYRLRRDWLEFDRMMKYADDSEADPAIRTYLRGMEALERYANREKAQALLEEALMQQPDLVRAQANLVLTETHTDAKYAQLQKLKSMNPNHMVVNLAGATIEEEYETAVELRSVMQND